MRLKDFGNKQCTHGLTWRLNTYSIQQTMMKIQLLKITDAGFEHVAPQKLSTGQTPWVRWRAEESQVGFSPSCAASFFPCFSWRWWVSEPLYLVTERTNELVLWQRRWSTAASMPGHVPWYRHPAEVGRGTRKLLTRKLKLHYCPSVRTEGQRDTRQTVVDLKLHLSITSWSRWCNRTHNMWKSFFLLAFFAPVCL